MQEFAMPVTASDIRGLRINESSGYLFPTHYEGWENFQSTLVSWLQSSEPIMEFKHEDQHVSLRKNGIVYLVVESDCDHHNANICVFKSEYSATAAYMLSLSAHVQRHAIEVGREELGLSKYLVFGDGSWIYSDDYDANQWTHRDPPTEVWVDMTHWDGSAEKEEAAVKAAIHATQH
jgi:hypothetical protein